MGLAIPFGLLMAAAAYALPTRRDMHLYGTTSEQGAPKGYAFGPFTKVNIADALYATGGCEEMAGRFFGKAGLGPADVDVAQLYDHFTGCVLLQLEETMSERFLPDGMPPPLADATTLPWWRAACEHRPRVQRCASCGHTRLPPAPVCPESRSADFDWRDLSGRGEVYTYTIVRRPIGAGQKLPHIIAVIALEDAGAVRRISNLVGVEPEAVAIGLPVALVWEDMSAELAIPRFRPVS